MILRIVVYRGVFWFFRKSISLLEQSIIEGDNPVHDFFL